MILVARSKGSLDASALSSTLQHVACILKDKGRDPRGTISFPHCCPSVPLQWLYMIGARDIQDVHVDESPHGY